MAAKEIEIKEVRNYKELPKVYIALPNDGKEAMRILLGREDKLLRRGWKIKRPVIFYRLTQIYNEVPKGKKITKRKRAPYTLMVAELEKT